MSNKSSKWLALFFFSLSLYFISFVLIERNLKASIVYKKRNKKKDNTEGHTEENMNS